jgi:isoleucyl-tRNA synthetase
MWSIAEETALADAETEYYDHVSPAIFVKFPLALAKERLGHDACIVIWTTTPWTIPANRAVAFSPNIDYAVHRIDVASDGCLLKIGEHIILAQTLTEEFMQKAHVASWTVTQFFVPSEDDFCFHPLAQANDALNKDNQAFWGENIPLLTADFVTDTVGTGFVHIAPSHGIDDYKLGLLHKLSMTDYIDKKGAFSSDVPIFSGHSVFLPDGTEGTANSKVMELLTQLEKIAGHEKVTHSYPHSWRSKTPLIFRNTPQWFIDLDTLVQDEKSIREKALSAIDKDVRWIPEKGRNRIYNMVANRPDWVVSRQRTWGVPLCCFVNKDTRQLLKDEKINERIVQIFRKEGADAWFQENSAQRFLAPLYNPEEWEKVTDILDVWFDSGSTHAFVLEKTGKHTWPASLYLEGTDQHRGWFHSSLIESCATRGKAPYEAVLTHGFVLDNNGEKMSKSKGNIITPQEIIDTYGTDIMRLWIAQSDFSEDLRVGTAILKSASDTYYRVRNIMRYLIGSLQGFEDAESVHSADMPELERYTLHRVVELDTIVQQSYEDFLFQRLFSEVFGFCSSWLSAFYFDVRKDSLYCDPPQSITRRSYRTVLNILFNRLVTWLSPIMPFMAEEVWQMRHPESPSVHLQIFPNTPDKWKNSILDEKWHKIREVRRTFDAALESERTEQMKSSSDVFLVVHLLPEYHDIFDVDFSMICLTSGYKTERIMDKQTHIPNSSTAVSDGFILELKKATGEKCARCRKILPEVGTNSAHDDLCTRCIDVIENKYNN